jgi:hypothetical protein
MGAIAGIYGAIAIGMLAAWFGGTATQISGPTGPMTVVSAASCFVKSTSNDLTAVGITTCLPSELTSSLRIGEFPCRLLQTKNHHFASSVSLIFSERIQTTQRIMQSLCQYLKKTIKTY